MKPNKKRYIYFRMFDPRRRRDRNKPLQNRINTGGGFLNKLAIKAGEVLTSPTAVALTDVIGNVSGRMEGPGFPGEAHYIFRDVDPKTRMVKGLVKGSWCGPGTNINARMRRGDQGVNSVDKICKQHDLDYSLAKTARDVTRADGRMLKTMAVTPSPRVHPQDKKIIAGLMGAKMIGEKVGLLSPETFTPEIKGGRRKADPTLRKKMKILKQAKKQEGGAKKPKKRKKRKGAKQTIQNGGLIPQLLLAGIAPALIKKLL